MSILKLNITLRQLRAFVMVYERGSFSAAAETLSTTQGAVSHLVTELEKQLGFRVLERTTRKLGLTKSGELYLRQARKVLAEVQKLNTIGEDLLRGSESSFRLGGTAAIIASTLPSILLLFSHRWPDLYIELTDFLPDALVDAVARGNLDLAVGIVRQDVDEAVHVDRLFSSALMVVVARNHPLAGESVVPWERLLDQTLVTQSRRSIPHLERSTGLDFSATHIINLSQLHSILSLVESADGVTIVADYALKYLSVHNVVALPLVDPEVVIDVGLYRRKGHELPEAATIFEAFIKELYQGGDVN